MSYSSKNYGRSHRKDSLKHKSTSESYHRSQRSRSRSPLRRESMSLLKAIIQGYISENLEIKSKSYASVLDNFKLKPESVKSPYDFSTLPVFTDDPEISKLLDESRELRQKARALNPEITDNDFSVSIAEMNTLEVEVELQAIRAKINDIS